jgi:Domain of unknown function (DUF1707)
VARHSTLRASDADRDAVAERLRAAAVEGRLEPDELEERLHRALRARTYGELDRLLGDLPGGRLIAPRPRRAVSAGGTMLVLAVRLAVALAVVSVLVIAIALTAMWWLIGIVVWLTLRGGRSCRPRGTFHRRRPAHPF